MFRFDAPLLFTNVERFKKAIYKALKQWQSSKDIKQIIPTIVANTKVFPTQIAAPFVKFSIIQIFF